ncbi:ABC transporter permease [Leuconostoc lactis]|uniref:ABC transporter permease n=1 Tax=Leuconostoc lactis TaxID=1246 RepID=UPI00020D9CBF|nr:ABC transporter permease [Leuconostoc lactis]MCT3115666.1 ABC transporter permease [Leuconostoc lactis]ORI84752.1 ABC transporter permease [Leuconostoc lactis]ORI86994.1 ABC transporter permease [Leuconostoc lactis]GHC19825.1 ABC transporter permease [Leuconostoc lactis KCTC 3528 = DSM 20202]
MLTLMKQEYYKAFKQNRLYIWLVLSFLFPLAVMGIFKTQRTGEVVANFGQATVYIVFAGIIITALSVSQEFGFGTIRPLLSRRFSRGQIFASKLLLNLSVYLALFVTAFLGTMLAKVIFVLKVNLQAKLNDMGTGWQVMGQTFVITMLQIIFIAALVLLITNLVKSSGAAIGLGVVMIVGTPILTSLSALLIEMAPIMKWNPFNIYLGIAMLELPKTAFKALVHLPQTTVLWVYLIDIVLMYGVAYWIFKKRSV